MKTVHMTYFVILLFRSLGLPVYTERKINHAVAAYSEDWIKGANDPC
jgi:hypothetical protein